MSLGAPSEDISVGALVCLQKQRIKEASIFSVFMHFIRFVTSAQLHDKRRSIMIIIIIFSTRKKLTERIYHSDIFYFIVQQHPMPAQPVVRSFDGTS